MGGGKKKSLLRRVNGIVAVILIPDTATEQNCAQISGPFYYYFGYPWDEKWLTRNVVIPPKTADGIATRDAANFEKIPIIIRKKLYQV